MQEMTAQSWKRRGCSIVWSPELLSGLITDTEATPLRVALEWQQHGLPESPPAAERPCSSAVFRRSWKSCLTRIPRMLGFAPTSCRFAACGAITGMASPSYSAWMDPASCSSSVNPMTLCISGAAPTAIASSVSQGPSGTAPQQARGSTN